MRSAEERHDAVVVQFQNHAVKNESQGGDQVRPNPGQQHAGNNNDQRIEEVQRTVPSSGLVNDQTDQNQISEDLQRSLQPVLLPEGQKQYVKQREAVPEQNGRNEEPQ